MSIIQRNPDQHAVDGSILDTIPAPEEIRAAMTRNADENRVLRSLYRLSRRLAERKRQAANDQQGVPHE